ncbi:response regulator [Alphaproteobacteria bacterium KMM 3653]|uniref:Response regulator n=1 Tax=Harenicola maris TaxID=2841044 RepID=A0AAP2CXW1_9RHOB|nr:response regulator [Harenicola maris]
MNVLIVESNPELGRLWRRHLERLGAWVMTASSQTMATDILAEHQFNAIVLDLMLDEGSALAVSDFASYRQPDAKVVFVTNTSFFSDGSIFAHAPNACAFIQSATPPGDLAELVTHYGAGVA